MLSACVSKMKRILSFSISELVLQYLIYPGQLDHPILPLRVRQMAGVASEVTKYLVYCHIKRHSGHCIIRLFKRKLKTLNILILEGHMQHGLDYNEKYVSKFFLSDLEVALSGE